MKIRHDHAALFLALAILAFANATAGEAINVLERVPRSESSEVVLIIDESGADVRLSASGIDVDPDLDKDMADIHRLLTGRARMTFVSGRSLSGDVQAISGACLFETERATIGLQQRTRYSSRQIAAREAGREVLGLVLGEVLRGDDISIKNPKFVVQILPQSVILEVPLPANMTTKYIDAIGRYVTGCALSTTERSGSLYLNAIMKMTVDASGLRIASVSRENNEVESEGLSETLRASGYAIRDRVPATSADYGIETQITQVGDSRVRCPRWIQGMPAQLVGRHCVVYAERRSDALQIEAAVARAAIEASERWDFHAGFGVVLAHNSGWERRVLPAESVADQDALLSEKATVTATAQACTSTAVIGPIERARFFGISNAQSVLEEAFEECDGVSWVGTFPTRESTREHIMEALSRSPARLSPPESSRHGQDVVAGAMFKASMSVWRAAARLDCYEFDCDLVDICTRETMRLSFLEWSQFRGNASESLRIVTEARAEYRALERSRPRAFPP